MKVYKVKVNGKVFEVEVEAVTEESGSIKKEVSQSTNTVSDGANTIIAPIAGKIVEVKVNVGDMVTKGQTVAIIEAMKLQNEIKSEFSGKVVEIKVNANDDVKNKDILIVLG